MQKTFLSPHFTLEELTTTKTGITNIPNDNDVNQLRNLCNDILEPLREKLGCPLFVDSGFRSQAVNEAVGGVPTSQHKLGQAADIHSSVQTSRIWDAINSLVINGSLNIGQCIWYRKSNFIHVSLPTRTLENDFMKLDK